MSSVTIAEIDERLRHAIGGRGHDDAIVGRMLGPSRMAVAHSDVRVGAAELRQERARPLGEFRHDLDLFRPEVEFATLRYRAITNGFRFLRRVQRADGSWLPLWFGNQHAPDDINPTYSAQFAPFSPPRLFVATDTNVLDVIFTVPGNGTIAAGVTGFGAVFTDVDKPNGVRGGAAPSTKIEYFDAAGRRIFTGFVPAAPGDGGLSFFGVVFEDARIARVRITTGTTRPGRDDTANRDIVMMDNFIYGEPQPVQ